METNNKQTLKPIIEEIQQLSNDDIREVIYYIQMLRLKTDKVMNKKKLSLYDGKIKLSISPIRYQKKFVMNGAKILLDTSAVLYILGGKFDFVKIRPQSL